MNHFVPQKIFIENAARHLPLTQKILKKCPQVPSEIVPAAREFIQYLQTPGAPAITGKKTLFLCRNKGRFLERCPGTKKYLCCGYTILNTGTGCPLDCTYCVLQAYLNNPCITVYANWDDMWSQLESSQDLLQKKVLRLGTGEYTDSLALEHLTDFIPAITAFLKKRPGVMLELKTKTIHITPLLQLAHRDSLIVSWSLNSEAIAGRQEEGAASIKDRVKAAARLAREGYRLGFHFDPLIFYPGWEAGYRNTVDLLARHIPPAQISWISLGSLRCMPALKLLHQQRFPSSTIFSEEFIIGLDGKLRYLQDIRIELYATMAAWLRAYDPEIFIYLCMENRLVWQKTLGFAPASNSGLKKMLDQRC